jgi:hypothetical protein
VEGDAYDNDVNANDVLAGVADARDSTDIGDFSVASVDETDAASKAPWPPLRTLDATAAAMLANANVFTLADYYAVPSLKERAVEKLLARANGGESGADGWPTDALVLMLHIVTQRVRPGETLYDVVFAAAIERASQLVVHRRFRQLMHAAGAFAADFAAGLVAKSTLEQAAQRERAAAEAARQQEELARVRAELRLARASSDEQKRRRERLESALRTYTSCRHCGADFQYVPDGEQNYFRCSKCRTRHHY